MDRRDRERMNQTLARIAARELGIETLKPRMRDCLDFHEIHVAAIERALIAAYEAGMKAVENLHAHECVRGDGKRVQVTVPRDGD